MVTVRVPVILLTANYPDYRVIVMSEPEINLLLPTERERESYLATVLAITISRDKSSVVYSIE